MHYEKYSHDDAIANALNDRLATEPPPVIYVASKEYAECCTNWRGRSTADAATDLREAARLAARLLPDDISDEALDEFEAAAADAAEVARGNAVYNDGDFDVRLTQYTREEFMSMEVVREAMLCSRCSAYLPSDDDGGRCGRCGARLCVSCYDEGDGFTDNNCPQCAGESYVAGRATSSAL